LCSTTPFLLVQHYQKFRELVQNNPMFQEAKMLQSIEEVGIEKGIEKGIERGILIGLEKGEQKKAEETAVKMLLSQWLNKEQISEITGLDRKKLDELEKRLKTS